MNRKNIFLTVREKDTLILASYSKSNNAIGKTLYISPSTVKAHLGQIFRKLGVENRTQAVLLAIELGLIPPPNSKQP